MRNNLDEFQLSLNKKNVDGSRDHFDLNPCDFFPNVIMQF